jgi:hypothetical protein
MPKYEIWGDDGTGKTAILSYVTGDLPDAGDTALVRGEVRSVERVWRHHSGPQATHRVGVAVAAADGGGSSLDGEVHDQDGNGSERKHHEEGQPASALRHE